MRYYTNGILAGKNTAVTWQLNQVSSVLNYIARSLYTGRLLHGRQYGRVSHLQRRADRAGDCHRGCRRPRFHSGWRHQWSGCVVVALHSSPGHTAGSPDWAGEAAGELYRPDRLGYCQQQRLPAGGLDHFHQQHQRAGSMAPTACFTGSMRARLPSSPSIRA